MSSRTICVFAESQSWQAHRARAPSRSFDAIDLGIASEHPKRGGIPVGAEGGGPSGSAGSPSRSRSAVTNGRRMFVEPVPNSKWARRFRDVLAEIISELCERGELSWSALSS